MLCLCYDWKADRTTAVALVEIGQARAGDRQRAEKGQVASDLLDPSSALFALRLMLGSMAGSYRSDGRTVPRQYRSHLYHRVRAANCQGVSQSQIHRLSTC